jgi:chromosomal replication initiation ATPase DnaA
MSNELNQMVQELKVFSKSIKENKIDILDIVEHVSRCTGVPIKDIMSRCRKSEMKNSRQIAQFLACITGDFTLVNIAEFFFIDHTTVIHSRDKCKDTTAQNDKELYKKLSMCIETFERL